MTTTPNTIVKEEDVTALEPVQARLLEQKLAAVIRSQPQFALLAHRLLAVGGVQVAAVLEEDLEPLLARGRTRRPHTITHVQGEPSGCHANAAALYQPHRHRIVTGWALSRDGLWRQHSWCEQNSKLIETTLPRAIYYGYQLNERESAAFCLNNQLACSTSLGRLAADAA
jgi:hypothetical protein